MYIINTFNESHELILSILNVRENRMDNQEGLKRDRMDNQEGLKRDQMDIQEGLKRDRMGNQEGLKGDRRVKKRDSQRRPI
jgi:hypothetical protein